MPIGTNGSRGKDMKSWGQRSWGHEVTAEGQTSLGAWRRHHSRLPWVE